MGLPKKIDPTLLSRRIEEICALGLLEDYEKRTAGNSASTATAATAGSSVPMVSSSSITGGGGVAGSSSAAAAAAAAALLNEDMDVIFGRLDEGLQQTRQSIY